MKRNNKKGFTIIELVIVIAVIAILAAVLIPTFSSIIKKANTSADIQAVNTMNKALAINEVTQGKNITEVHSALAECGLTSKDYHPLTSNTYFFWDAKVNRIVYTDDTYTVIYPDEYKDTKFNATTSEWYSLSGEIEEKSVTVSNDGSVSISSAEELYYIANNNSTDIKKITINNDINAMGADVGIEVLKGQTVEIDFNSKTITGLAQVSSAWTNADSKGDSYGKVYASGLIQNVEGKKDGVEAGKVTIKNVTIDGGTFGSLEIGSVGALVGAVGSNAEVTIEDCTVKNVVVYGKNKVGGLIGGFGGKSLTIKGCSVENVTVNCSEGQAATVIGCVYNNPTVSIDREFKDWVTGENHTNLVKGTWDRETLTGDITVMSKITSENQTATSLNKTFNGVTLVAEYSSDGKHEKDENKDNYTGTNAPKYRIYTADAYCNIQLNNSAPSGNGAATFKIGTDNATNIYTTAYDNITFTHYGQINNTYVFTNFMYVI